MIASSLRKAAEIAPNNPAILNNYAWCLMQSEPPDLEQAITLQPGHLGAHVNLGNFLKRKGASDQAASLIFVVVIASSTGTIHIDCAPIS